MFGMSREPTEEQIKRLQQDLIEVRHLANIVSFIHFVPSGKYPEVPTSYKIYMEIRSIVAVDEDNGETVLAASFTFDIKLSSKYPALKPECVVTPTPFHPHFEPRFRQGIWVDPYEKDEGLGSLLLRIAHSLKYEPEYIDEQCRNIGNKDALLWYMRIKQKSPNLFPIDKRPLPHTLHITNKTFAVQPKKFEIQNNQKVTSPLQAHPIESTTSPRKTFKIVESTSAYKPIVKDLPTFDASLHSDFHGQQSGYELYITEKAKNQIFEHIGWDQKTELNRNEQGGILLGQVYKDTQKGIVYGVAEEAIAGEAAKGTSAYLEMNHATWKKMIDRVDKILDAHAEKNLQIIGWYHTHPNQLDVFMSSTDTATQSRLFSRDWHFAVVMNPHKKIWRVFHGENSEECMGFMIGESKKNNIEHTKDKPDESRPSLIDQDEFRNQQDINLDSPVSSRWSKKNYMLALMSVTVMLCLGVIGVIYANRLSSTQETVSVSPTVLDANVFVTTPTISLNIETLEANKGTSVATSTIFATPTSVYTVTSTLIAGVPSPTESFTPVPSVTETSFSVPTVSISSPTPLTNSTTISSTANILLDACLKTDKLYQFEAQAPINIYNIYVSISDPAGTIQQNEIFVTGTQASGEILGIISSNNKDWFYITYKENRYWILLDDLQKLAVCLP